MTNTNTIILESSEYAEDAHNLLASQHIYNMYVGLPTEIKQALAAGEHVSGLMGAANAEWTRRNAQGEAPFPTPKFLGSVERALRLVAMEDLN